MYSSLANKPVENGHNNRGGSAIIFVHGLSGSPKSTWGKMSACMELDPDFKDVTIDYYAYPTRLVRLPFTPPLPGLRDLADGLRTFIEERHGTRDSISIVAHSLGGLIARYMVTSAIRSGRSLNVSNMALLAVPSTGATLANVGSLFSFPHRQLKTLCKDQDGLATLNVDWEQLKVEESINVRYIVGGCDRTVPADSAAPYIGRDNKSVIIEADHRSIVSPLNLDDIRYKTLKRFIIGEVVKTDVPPSDSIVRTFERPADPLFDVYTPYNEPYYLVRSFDKILIDIIGRGHVWLTGDSGIGKTAAARRAIYSSGWRLCHINMSGHEINDERQLFAALCSELSVLADDGTGAATTANFAEHSALARRALLKLRADKVVASLIEEMPVDSSVLSQSADVIARFLELVDADDRLYGQVRFVFSSREAVTSTNSGLSSKAREKIQFLPVETWSAIDVGRLIQLLAPTVRSQLSADEREQIARAARGSPRFVKMVFRHYRNGTAGSQSVDSLCQQVQKELVS